MSDAISGNTGGVDPVGDRSEGNDRFHDAHETREQFYLASINDSAHAIREDVTGMHDEMGGMRTDGEAVRGDVAQMREDLAGTRDDVAGMRTDGEAVRGDVANLRDDVAGVRTDGTDVRGNVAAIRTTLDRAFPEQRPPERLDGDALRIASRRAARGEIDPPLLRGEQTVDPGSDAEFSDVEGHATLRSRGHTVLGDVPRGASLNAPDLEGRFEGGKVAGRATFDNTRRGATAVIEGVTKGGRLEVSELKGEISAAVQGHAQLGRPGVPGISQGFRGERLARHDGRANLDLSGTAIQHFAPGSLGSTLHYGGPAETTARGNTKFTPSGPGGKFRSPVMRNVEAVGIGVAGLATTYAVGAANSIGIYNGARTAVGASAPTHTVTVTAPGIMPSTTPHVVGLEAAPTADITPDVLDPTKIGIDK